MTYDLHPLCAAFPEMPDADYQALKADIDDRGIVQPIVLFEGKILDGRHRARACDELGIPIPITHFPGSSDAVSFVIAMNLLRRHMSADQRVAIVAKLRGPEVKAAAAKRVGGRPKKTGAETGPGFEKGKAAHAIAADAKVGRNKARAALVLQDQAPDLLDEVAEGKTTLPAAAREANARTAPPPPPARSGDKALDAASKALDLALTKVKAIEAADMSSQTTAPVVFARRAAALVAALRELGVPLP